MKCFGRQQTFPQAYSHMHEKMRKKASLSILDTIPPMKETRLLSPKKIPNLAMKKRIGSRP